MIKYIHYYSLVLIKMRGFGNEGEDDNPIERHRRIDSAHNYGNTTISGSNLRLWISNGEDKHGNES